MKHKPVLVPKAFLYGKTAQKAVMEKGALPFVGQENRLAFSMVEFSAFHECRCESVASLLSCPERLLPPEWQEDMKRLTVPLPMAGLPEGPLVMGILNVTPDSFSDGGRHLALVDAIRAGHQMVQNGAAIIDIGGESTRPDSQPVGIEEECHRIIPVIKALKNCGALLSVDTRHAETMKHALQAGADMINDISALDDPDSLEVIAQANCPIVLMHMRGTPQTMGGHAVYRHVLTEVMEELSQKIERAVQAGIRREKIILDPGVGFAKDSTQNMELLKGFPAFAGLGCRLLLAVSRKRFIKGIVGNMPYDQYDPATMVATSPACFLGNGIMRVHNVPAMVQTVKMWDALYS